MSWLQGLLYVIVLWLVLTSLGFRFLTVNTIRNKQRHWQEIPGQVQFEI